MKLIRLAKVFVFLALLSCDKEDSISLKHKVEQLEIENKILSDSLEKIKYNSIASSELVLLPQLYTFNKNETGVVSGIFRQRQKFPKFNLYHVNDKFEYDESDQINYKLTKDNGFDFTYNKNDTIDDKIRVIAVFDLDTVEVGLYGITSFSKSN
ncbi:hypothetical protein [uncultured Flavobacterium sp.]|uniref:hypothetical protein n=1 Tax=uncultured Flavobacterium sp. TaxID=165435 RepID=UPI0025D2E03D|nr:hypothetical protein [uncultured Flavobacterium sp.]